MTSLVPLWAGEALLFLIAALPVFAQTTPPEAASAAPATMRRIQYGVRFGPAFTTLSSVEPFDSTIAAAAPEPTMNFGGFMVIGIAGPLALQPEILFAAKGHRIHDKDAQPTFTGTGTRPPQADRVILLRYRDPDASVYFIGGPALAIRRSAVIRDVADPGRFEDIADHVSGNNLSLVFGGGLQYRRWLVDARFTKGLRNVAIVPFPTEVKTSAFAVLLGVRL
jgi:hypothetical protein